MENSAYWPGWEMVRQIGKGGFGTVYEIQREVFGDRERAALKIITIPKNDSEIEYMKCEGMDDESITDTLHSQVGDIINEYKLMTHLRENPNIVHCDDFRYVRHENDLGWDIFIKMELLTPLTKIIEQMKDEGEIIRLGIELCNALLACQKHNIIHRDIKPQNIFISPAGYYKLGDFGIARTIEHTTRATASIGTHSFMAPEVALGKSYGSTVDIYSLGLVLYWLLNDRRGPFVPLPPAPSTFVDNDLARTRRYSGEKIPSPQNGGKQLQAIVLKACAFDPKDRYQTVQEMLLELRRIEHTIAQQGNGIEIVPAPETQKSNVQKQHLEYDATVASKEKNSVKKVTPENHPVEKAVGDSTVSVMTQGSVSDIRMEDNIVQEEKRFYTGENSTRLLKKLIKKSVDEATVVESEYFEGSAQLKGSRKARFENKRNKEFEDPGNPYKQPSCSLVNQSDLHGKEDAIKAKKKRIWSWICFVIAVAAFSVVRTAKLPYPPNVETAMTVDAAVTEAALSECSHSWIPADCTTPKTCDICGETFGVALGHAWKDATYETPKTCSICGATDGVPLEKPTLRVKDVVSFGYYEQDGMQSNGKEPIEWIVLEVVDDKALLLSCYALDSLPYNDTYKSVTWEDCTLRNWLNEIFYDTAFSDEEKESILLSEIDNSKAQGNRKWNISGGNNTEDNIFLLSYAEVERYFTESMDRICVPTNYAITKGAEVRIFDDKTTLAGWWWLRSPGERRNQASFVNFDGSRYTNGVGNAYLSVRPALWIAISGQSWHSELNKTLLSDN